RRLEESVDERRDEIAERRLVAEPRVDVEQRLPVGLLGEVVSEQSAVGLGGLAQVAPFTGREGCDAQQQGATLVRVGRELGRAPQPACASVEVALRLTALREARERPAAILLRCAGLAVLRRRHEALERRLG